LMGIVGHYGYAISAGGSHARDHGIGTLEKAVLIVCGVVASPLGVRLQSRLPAAAIKKTVVVVVACSASYVLLRA
ncbi:MAG: hypothetical protein JWP29_2172, partial [Rhodoferax sp.]|nr:hypothetical protein [Rhodoferax sp.]